MANRARPPPVPQVLDELDDVLAFLTKNQQFKSAASHTSRAHVVQQRALVILRDLIVTQCNGIQAQLLQSKTFTDYIGSGKSEGPGPQTEPQPPSAEGPDATEAPASDTDEAAAADSNKITILGLTEVLNVEFEAKLDAVMPLIRQLEQRCIDRKDSQIYLNDVLGTYYDCRIALLSPILGHYLTTSATSDEHGPLGMLVEHGIPYLLAISVDECKLFHQFFSLQTVSAHLKSMVEGIGMVVYEKFRSYVLKVDDLKQLSDVVDNLRNTLLLGKLKSAGPVYLGRGWLRVVSRHTLLHGASFQADRYAP